MGMDKMVVGPDGSLQLTEEHRRRWGLLPGAEYWVRETPEGLLFRRADPPLTNLYVEPTSRCNLNCRTCVRNSWSEPLGTMEMDVYRRLVRDLRSVSSLQRVSFWGFGEPLLHPDIVEMVALAKGLGARTQLITNALLLDHAISQGLVDAGLDSLVVSIDGGTPEAHAAVRSGADLSLIERNVTGFRAAGKAAGRADLEVGLEFVLMRSNAGELARLHQLANGLGASFVVISHILPYTEDMREEILYGNYAGTCYPIYRNKWNPDVVLPRIDWQREVADPLSSLLRFTRPNDAPRGRLDGAGGYCRFVSEGSAVVAWDGGLSPCIPLMHSYTCYVMRREKRIRRYSVGNVGQEQITKLWEREEFVRFRDLVQRFEFSPCSDCGGCNFAESNEEDCFGNSFPVCGDCLWAKGVIQCP